MSWNHVEATNVVVEYNYQQFIINCNNESVDRVVSDMTESVAPVSNSIGDSTYNCQQFIIVFRNDFTMNLLIVK